MLAWFASYRILLEVGGIVVLALALYFYAYRQGSASVQREWDAAEVIRRQVEWEREKENDKRAHDAAARYEAASAALTAGRSHATAKRIPALLAPVACAGALGAVRVPAAVLDSLRDVAPDGIAPSRPAATGGSGSALFRGP